MISQQLKDRWLVALRGGRYQQNFGGFRSQDWKRHCAIGVLIDLIDPEALSDSQHNDVHISDLIGLATTAKIVSFNDHSRYSFEAIADWIEANIHDNRGLSL